MSELQNKLDKTCIRGQLNLVYSMMKLLATILDLAADNEMARKVLADTANSLFQQNAILTHDICKYTEKLGETK